jgi:Putative transposase/Transposase zinc-binding domain
VRPALEVADIFRRHGEAFRAAQGDRLSSEQRRVMGAIQACRTATLGGHVEQCDACGVIRIAYNSCRNRHCPKCQGLARVQWVADRQADLLPVPYFHVVFTVPAPVAAIALQNKAVAYDILFKAAADTIRVIGADLRHLGAETGMIAVLHTWGQTLTHHPHLHCVVPGGGLASDGRWIACRPGFFLPVRVLSRLFRRLFLQRLQAAFDAGRLKFFGDLEPLIEPPIFVQQLKTLRTVEWLVYAKRPFAGPQQVLDYLGRYTHRVAIANSRLLACDGASVRFRWKDYRDRDKAKVMTLGADEFIRRFLLHVLPTGFRRIRHFGFLANACRVAKLAQIRLALTAPEPPPAIELAHYRERCERLTGHRIDLCPDCGGHMREIATLPRSSPTTRPTPRPDTS